MRTIYNSVIILLSICLATGKAYAQEASALDKALSLPDRLIASINKKTSAIENRLDKQTEKYLHKLQKQENRLKRKIYKKDSTLAKQLFTDAEGKYQTLQRLGMVKELKKYQKQVYYYQAQVQEIRSLWEELNKLEEKLLQAAMK